MKKIRESIALKVTAFVGAIFMLWVCIACAVGIVFLFDMEVYTKSESTLRYDVFRNVLSPNAYYLMYDYVGDPLVVKPNEFSEDNYTYEIFVDGVRAEGDCEHPEAYSAEWTFEFIYTKNDFLYQDDSGNTVDDPYDMGDRQYSVRVYVDPTLSVDDELSFCAWLLHLIYSMRFAVYVILVLAALVALVCFIYLMVAAGHRAGVEGIACSGFTRVPFDLVTAGVLFAACLVISLVSECSYGAEEAIISLAIAAVTLPTLFLVYCMTLATRLKMGGGEWWRNTVIWWALKLLWRILCATGRGIAALFHAIPLVWKTALGGAAMSIFCFFVFVPSHNTEPRLFWWFALSLLLFPSFIYIAYMLRRLLRASDALARGDLSYQVNTKYMFAETRRAGENLNNIAAGMTAAVDERMKSERLKTELITNVSHDIKTPLTSIINYTDLICREQTENERIREYSTELLRQSERLKKLIEDLIEASKASTGNIEVHLAPCEIGVMLMQTAGEYQGRLEERGLTLITGQPEEPLRILADGRQLWRVLDNLLGNACKYSQAGTRVYLTLTREGGDAVIAIKNTSGYELNIPADELMERFVRGDSSRSTSGSGLGLSIAKSLVELQGGTLSLTIDGDLFKVVLRFPLCS
ncbi:MAG: HAMP domain-containing histidine kinase [Clostridia bacterium]|nr:HAMP domain-containing histidine kinase [Clostridia bacterium]